jgi:hypothetical protein
MNRIAIAAIVVVVLIIIVYFATRSSSGTVISGGASSPPGPSPAVGQGLPGTAPGSNNSCPPPQTYDTAMGRCVDTQLPGLLTAAQSAAATLWATLTSLRADVHRNFNTSNGTYIYLQDTVAFQAAALSLQAMAATNFQAAAPAAASQLLNSVNFAQIHNSTVSLSATISKLRSIISPPGCASGTGTCGYVQKIASLNPTSVTANIINAGLEAASVPPLTSAVTSALDQVISAMQAAYSNINQYLGALPSGVPGVAPAVTTAAASGAPLAADIARLKAFKTSLTVAAAAVKQTGTDVYNHFIPST